MAPVDVSGQEISYCSCASTDRRIEDTPNERTADDYVAGFEALAEVVDYFVVNVSSPNAPNLRQLQEKSR